MIFVKKIAHLIAHYVCVGVCVTRIEGPHDYCHLLEVNTLNESGQVGQHLPPPWTSP
jgi:hypothetical protein